MENYQETEKKYGLIPLSEVKLNDKNPRTIKKDKLDDLIKSIRNFPQMLELRPLVLNQDNVVLGGNMRLRALTELGYEQVPFIRVEDLTPEQQDEFIVKDNLSFGEWEWDILETEWDKELLLDWGMDIPDHKFANADEAYEDDYVGSIPTETGIQVGDVIQIGRHRIMCGDSTDPDHVRILMDGNKADLLLTDPPYGVSFEGVPAGKDWDMIENDDLRGDGLYLFLQQAFKNAYDHTVNSAAAYIWYSDQNYYYFDNALKNVGYHERQKILWVKGMVLNRSDYHFSHELCLYCSKDGYGVGWFGGRDKQTILNLKDRKDVEDMTKSELQEIVRNTLDQTDVWEIRKDAVVTYIHPTQKPVELSGKIINNSSPVNGKVMDLFLGSGSALIAAHQMGRTMFGMELDPKYVELIIDRMRHTDPEIEVTINGRKY